MHVVATVGFDPIDVDQWRYIAAKTPVPLAECLRAGKPVSCAGPEERAERYPLLVQANAPADSTVCVPIRHEGAVVGVLGVAFRGARSLNLDEWTRLAALADECGADLPQPAVVPDASLGAPPDLTVLDDPERWAEFARLGLADGEVDESVDRLTALAARLLGGENAQVSLLGQEQVVASTAGFCLPPDSRRQPLSSSLCSVCVAGGGPLVVADAPRHAWVHDLPPVREGRVRRYLGVPLVTAGGAAIGALCVFDGSDAPWPDDAVRILAELAAVTARTIELGSAARRLTVTAHRLHQLQEVTSRIATAATVEEIAGIVLDQGIPLVAPRGIVGVLSADRSALQTWSGLGLPADLVSGFRLLRWSAATQISEAVRTGAPVVLHSPSEIRARFPWDRA